MFKKELTKFIIYCCFGGVATLIYLILLYLLTSILGIYYLVSAVLSQPLAIITNFYLNKKYNFRNKSKKVYHQLFKFTIVVIGGIILNTILIYFMVEFLKVYYLLSAFLVALVIGIYSYLLHKHFSFKDR